MDTVAMDGEATTGLTATTVTTERGPLRLNLQLSQLLLPTLRLMLMLGMDTTDTVVTTATDTDTATTAPMDTGVTGAKPTNREVDSSSVRFSVDISQYFQSLRLVWAAGVCLVG